MTVCRVINSRNLLPDSDLLMQRSLHSKYSGPPENRRRPQATAGNTAGIAEKLVG